MASQAQWTRVWANSGRQWRTGKPGVLQSMGLPRVGHDLETIHCVCVELRESHSYFLQKGSSREDISSKTHSLCCMNCSTPGFPILHCLPEFAQTHVHWVGDAIQPSHPLSSPSPLALHHSQHQGLFQWVNSSHQVAKVLGDTTSASVLPMNIQNWFPLGWTALVSLQSKRLSGVFSNTTVQKHQFFGTQPSLQSNSHFTHDYWKNHCFDYMDSDVSAF